MVNIFIKYLFYLSFYLFLQNKGVASMILIIKATTLNFIIYKMLLFLTKNNVHFCTIFYKKNGICTIYLTIYLNICGFLIVLNIHLSTYFLFIRTVSRIFTSPSSLRSPCIHKVTSEAFSNLY